MDEAEELQDRRERVRPDTCCDPKINDGGRNHHCLYELFSKVADVNSGRSAAEVLEEFAAPVQRVTGCDFIVFSLHDSRQNCFPTRFWKSNGESGELKTRDTAGTISGWVWVHQQALVIEDFAQESRFAECLEELRAHGLNSFTAVPMTSSLRRFGILGFGRCQQQAPGPQGLEFFTRITRTATLALENRENMRAWKEQQNRLHNLAVIGRELRSGLQPEEAMAIVFRQLQQITKYDYAILALLEDDGQAIRVGATDLPGWKLPFSHRVPLSEATSMRAIQTRSITYLNEEDLAMLPGAFPALLQKGEIRSVCNIPLVVAGRVLGSLNLGSKDAGGFRHEDAAYLQEVGSHVAAALDQAHAYQQIAHLKGRLAQEKNSLESEMNDFRGDDIVGTSAGLKRVLEAASVVARTDATVLITGETGTGKERIARIIHSMSGRKERSFIKLNCAAIPTGLLESELFGHEKGAFTGAVSQKIGRLELADKGTLFLDEIGEIPLELQPKLLRVLQDYEFERLGGTRTIRVNIRLVAATNRDLAQAIDEREFRRDLFYRLHVFPIHLPALRERREDIPLLVRHFVARCAERLGKRITHIPEQVIETMTKWDWPGNIRELENFVERSVILSQNETLRAPLSELQAEAPAAGIVPDDTLRSREREHIIQMLRQTRGMLSGPSGAAGRLGLKRTTLQYRMQKLGISRADYLD